MSEESEPDEALLARANEVMLGVQSGKISGILCVCFMSNDSINIQVAGVQSLVVRLGSLAVAADALKLLETQQQVQRAQARQWAPGGSASN